MSQKIRRMGYLTYDRCVELLKHGRKDCRTIGPNTTLDRLGDGIFAVRFYSVDIIRYYPNGNVILSTGGYRGRTVTTKQRLCALSPVHVHQSKGEWYVGERKFEEGMNVGEPVDPITLIQRMAMAGDELAIRQVHDMQEEKVS